MRKARALAAAALALGAAPALALELPATTDPAFAEAYNGCLAAIQGGGFLDESAGWTSHDTGDANALISDHWSHGFATKEIEGVGGLNLSVVVEDYPGYRLGSCNVTILDLQREIDGPGLKNSGWLGTLQGDGADWWGLWRDPEAQLFVRAILSSEPPGFTLSMTSLTETP